MVYGVFMGYQGQGISLAVFTSFKKVRKSLNFDDLRERENLFGVSELGYSRSICFPIEQLSSMREPFDGSAAVESGAKALIKL